MKNGNGGEGVGEWGRGNGQGASPSPLPHPHPAVPVARLAAFPPDGLLGVTLPDGTPVCLVRHEDRVYALHDRCTHAEYSLSAGELHPDGTVQCLWHGATFDCRTGAVCRGPATEPVPTFAVRVEGDAVYVERGGNRGGAGQRPEVMRGAHERHDG